MVPRSHESLLSSVALENNETNPRLVLGISSHEVVHIKGIYDPRKRVRFHFPVFYSMLWIYSAGFNNNNFKKVVGIFSWVHMRE